MEVTSNTALFCQLPPPPKGPVPLSGSDPSVGDGKEKSKLPWEDRATHRLHQEGPTPLQPPGRSRHMRALAGLDLPPVRSGWSSTPMQVPGDSALPGTRQFDKACAQSSCPAWSPGGARGASRAQVPAAGQRNSGSATRQLTWYLSMSLKPRMCCSFRRQMGQRSRGRRRASSRLSAPCMRQRSQRQFPRPRRWQSSWHVTWGEGHQAPCLTTLPPYPADPQAAPAGPKRGPG